MGDNFLWLPNAKPDPIHPSGYFTRDDLLIFQQTLSARSPVPEDPCEIEELEVLYERNKRSWDGLWKARLNEEDKEDPILNPTINVTIAKMFYLMYCVPLEELPLHMDECERVLDAVIAWRMKIAK